MSHDSPTVSAVIIAKNEEATIRRCIKSVLDQSAAVSEIIVIDGNSTDHTMRYVSDLARQYDQINVETDEIDGSGPAAARNMGAALATGNLILFLNGDVTVGRDYVAGLLSLMDEKHLDAAAGLRWNVRNSLISGLMNVHYALSYESSTEMTGSPAFLSSDAMLIKSEAFWNVGGYDASMPAGEDADLGYRLRGYGCSIGYDRAATMWHEGGHYRSVADWFQQLKGYGRGAASLARAHRWRLEREQTRLHDNVVVPVSIILITLLTTIILFNALGVFVLGLGAIGFTALGFKYVQYAARVQQQCDAVDLPTELLPQDILLYPVFRVVRNAALSAFTWQFLLSSHELEQAKSTEDGRL